MSVAKTFIEGVYHKNPVFRLMLGLVPAVGATTVAWNSLYLGLMTGAILLVAAVVVTIVRPFVPKAVHTILQIAVLTVLVTAVHRWAVGVNPEMVIQLGIYIPLIVVNGVILQRLSLVQSLPEAVVGALGQGIGFTAALVIIGIIREFLAYGRVFDVVLLEAQYSPFALANTIPGSLLIVGLLMALVNALMGKGGEIHE